MNKPLSLKQVFGRALDYSPGVERSAFLDAACAADREFRDQVEALLLAHDAAEHFLTSSREAGDTVADLPDRTASSDPYATFNHPSVARVESDPGPIPDPEVTSALTDESADRVIGPYRLIETLGEGGMGTVYRAEQARPIRRQVALKVIKAGMDSAQVIARFDSERQALAIMDHPHIARVFDAGTTDLGRPYFVMELVHGVALNDYCDQHHVDLTGRLQLFRLVCAAVQHAHQKGIIHRDLKPGNILVEEEDGHPVPKIIDFGLAKAISGVDLGAQTALTMLGSINGTPLYMAPEQATFQAEDVDTRADIYALGVIFYELLTGSTPIRRESLHRAAFDEVLRLIREVEPQVPSQRLSSLDAAPSVAAVRQVEPARLVRLLRGDLDWIAMKALAKERDRRYPSATAFADDIERFLLHEPVSAGPPTARYRTGKFIRRHRAQVAAAGLVLAVLIGGIGGTTTGLIEARTQRGNALSAATRADQARQVADVARQGAEAERQKAEGRLKEVEKSFDLLGSIFTDINPEGPANAGRPLGIVIAERLDQAAAQIEQNAIGDPRTVARVLKTLAESQIGLGFPQKGIALFARVRATLQKQFRADDEVVLLAAVDLAEAELLNGNSKAGLQLLETTVNQMKARFGADHPLTLRTSNKLALAYFNNGRRPDGIELFNRTADIMETKIGYDDPDTIEAMIFRAVFDPSPAKLGKLERTHTLAKEHLGLDHPKTLNALNWIAIVTADQDRRRSLPIYEEVWRLCRLKYGVEGYETMVSLDTLIKAYRLSGLHQQALPLAVDLNRFCVARYGADYSSSYFHATDLGWAYRYAGQRDQAIAFDEELLAIRRAKRGPDDPATKELTQSLISDYVAVKKFEQAQTMAYLLMNYRPSEDAENSAKRGFALAFLGNVYRELGSRQDAEKFLRESIEILQSKAPDDPRTAMAQGYLGKCLYDRAKYPEAGPLLWAGVDGLKKQSQTYTKSGEWPVYRNFVEWMIEYTTLTGKTVGPAAQSIPMYEEVRNWYVTRAAGRFNDNADFIKVTIQLAGICVAADQSERARTLIKNHVALLAKPADPADMALARESLWFGEACAFVMRWAEAISALQEALDKFQKIEPEAWTTYRIDFLIGRAFMYTNELDRAEPFLRTGYEGLKRTESTIPIAQRGCIDDTLNWLITRAGATKKPDELKHWQTERGRRRLGLMGK